MAYLNIVKEYLKKLQGYYKAAESSGQYTAELSFRPALNYLLENLAANMSVSGDIDVVLEPKNQGKVGRPDWRIHDKKTLGIYGFVEAKGLSMEAFDISPYKNQIKKYLTLKHKLIITDGVDFVFCLNEKSNPTLISLVEKSVLLGSPDWSKLDINSQFELLMSQFFEEPIPQQCSEGRLVELVALRTRLLANEIEKYAEIPLEEAMDEDERNTISVLNEIKKLIYNHNDNTLKTGHAFADFTAQVIMFSLLYAHRVLCTSSDSPADKEKKIREYITEDLVVGEALQPFRKLMIFIRDNSSVCIEIAQWIEECIGFLSFVQMTETQLLNPDYHKLFEFFLSKYDMQTRFDYGAYYTPSSLANFAVRLTEKVALDVFAGASIYNSGNTIIDPCCGTGSFLEQVIANDSKNEKYNLCGFEIMPTPYMLANYRMAVAKKQYPSRRHTSHIILANTLSNCVFGEGINEDTIEGREYKRANEWASKPIKLIIGNPPCSDSSKRNISDDFSIINGLMEDFRPPIEALHGRQNIQKQINNPFMQFIRWGCNRLIKDDNNSILSFIVPLSFLEAESYRYARKYLCENFSSAWIVAIDADARTGIRNNSMFHTLQGRALIIFTRKYGESNNISEYHYVDISKETIEYKEDFFEKGINEISECFEIYSIENSFYSFSIAQDFDIELYNHFWPISGNDEQVAVFLNHCSGIKLAPTALFTHVKDTMLRRRTRDAALGQDISSWFVGQDRKPGQEKIKVFMDALETCGDRAKINELLSNNIKQYSFRPFLTSNVLLWEDVLKKYASIGGGGTRLRPEIIKTYNDSETIGFAMAHAPKDLNPSLTQFVSFCWYYPDNDMCTRGNSHIYMNLYQKKTDDEPRLNINIDLLEYYCSLLDCTMIECSEYIIFYVYGIMCSQLYLDEFEGALFRLNRSDDRARVPFIKDANMFLIISRLGRQLAELEKVDYIAENVLNYNYENILKELPDGFKLQNNSRGTLFDEENEELILSDGEQKIYIYCPIELQQLNISGYDVIKNVWLKFNSYDYTHCEFTKDDLTKLLNFLNILAERSRIVAELDVNVGRILRREYEFFTIDEVEF